MRYELTDDDSSEVGVFPQGGMLPVTYDSYLNW